MKRGFTLIEVLAVIGLIAIIGLLGIPLILNQINNRRGEISQLSVQMLGDAAELYIDKYKTTYPRTAGKTYCITLKALVDDGFLSEPIMDVKTNKKIDVLTKGTNGEYEAKTMMKVTVLNNVDLEYKFINKNDSDPYCRP